MSSPHDYQAVIDILTTGFDAKLIAHRLAKHHPAMFVDLHNMKEEGDYPDWHTDVIKYIMSGNYVSAIKSIREYTGFGLKDAKDIMDNLINAMIGIGYNLKERAKPYDVIAESQQARTLQALFNTSRKVKNYYA